MDFVIACFDYDATSNFGTSFKAGEVFTLIEKSNDEWSKVMRNDRSVIFVPANYVEEYAPAVGAPDAVSTSSSRNATPDSGPSYAQPQEVFAPTPGSKNIGTGATQDVSQPCMILFNLRSAVLVVPCSSVSHKNCCILSFSGVHLEHTGHHLLQYQNII